MGDSPNDPLRVDFDRQLQLELRGSTLTSDAGLLAYREAVKWTKLSCRRFRDNAARLHLFALACNLASFLASNQLSGHVTGQVLTVAGGMEARG